MKNLKQYIVPAIIALALLFSGGYIGSCTKKTDIAKFKEQLQVQQDSAIKVVEWSDSVKKASDARVKFVQDSTKRVQDSLNLVISKRSVQLKTMRVKNDSLLEAVLSDTSCNTPVCINATIAAQNYKKEADTALIQVADFRHKWELSEFNLLEMTNDRDNQKSRADALQQRVNSFVNMKPPKDPNKMFGLIPLPSRTASFFIGAGAATLTIMAIK